MANAFDFINQIINLELDHMGGYRTESNVYKFIKPIADLMLMLKQALDDIETMRDVDEAYGVHLNVLGRNVGISREGDDDVQFRRRIKVERQAQRSNGVPEELKEIAEIVLNHTVGLKEMWNESDYGNEAAGVIIEVVSDGESILIPDPTIEKAVSGGVRLAIEARNVDEIIEVQEPDATVFKVVSLRTGTFRLPRRMGSLF